MLHWCDVGLYRRSVCALICSFLSALVTSNSSKFELLSRIFLWFEVPSYSTHTLELFSRSGRRRTCAFQLPMRKSKSCDPSRCGRFAESAALCACNETEIIATRIITPKDATLVVIRNLSFRSPHSRTRHGRFWLAAPSHSLSQ